MNAALKTLIAATATIGAIATTTVAASAYPVQQQVVIVVSAQACDNYATAYANSHEGPRARPVILGGLLGAGAGFLVGGYGFGAPGVGAAVGAGVGALGGAALGNRNWNGAYTAAYQACMQGTYLPY